MTTDENRSPIYPVSISSIPSSSLGSELAWLPLHKPVESAATLMQLYKYDQIPVFDSDRPLLCKLAGVATWQSIERARLGQQNEPTLAEALTKLPVVKRDEELFAAIPRIMEAEAALVRHQGQIDGIVTAYDLSKFLASRLEPFLIFNEIEIHLHTLVGRLTSEGEFDQDGDPSDSMGTGVGLTIGRCIEKLDSAENWSRLALSQDREIVIQELKVMCAERNAFMHGRRLDVVNIGRHRHLLDYLRGLAKPPRLYVESTGCAYA